MKANRIRRTALVVLALLCAGCTPTAGTITRSVDLECGKAIAYDATLSVLAGRGWLIESTDRASGRITTSARIDETLSPRKGRRRSYRVGAIVSELGDARSRVTLTISDVGARGESLAADRTAREWYGEYLASIGKTVEGRGR